MRRSGARAGIAALALALAAPAGAAPVAVAVGASASAEGEPCRRALVDALQTHGGVRFVALDPAPPIGVRSSAASVRDALRDRDVGLWIAHRVEPSGAGAGAGAGVGPSELEVQLRSPHSGARIDSLRVPVAGDCTEAAQRVVAAAHGVLAGEPVEPGAGDGLLEGLRAGELPRDQPIAIRSDELEVLRGEDRSRHLVFRANVHVTQGDVTLRSDRLEAFYPEGAGEPERMVAEGEVEVRQAGRLATCERALYLRSTRSVRCTGRAELLDGCDRVRGRSIELDLERETVRVEGAASVWIGSREAAAEGCRSAGAG